LSGPATNTLWNVATMLMAVKLPHAERPSTVKNTQEPAIKQARKFGPEGVVHVKQTNGKFRKVQDVSRLVRHRVLGRCQHSPRLA
jgi:hypothetical protein